MATGAARASAHVVAALGSSFLYLLGYLVLRFHLTVLGIGTDLHVLDERYLFDGARFLVYLLSTIPTVVLLGLLLAALVAATALSAWLFWCSRSCGLQPGWSLGLHCLLRVLVALQGLLLPVNYGILVVDKTVPRVATLGDQKVLAPGQDAWLVWEGVST